MQTWKIKRNTGHYARTKSKWKLRAGAIVLLLATLGAGIYDFPVVWNDAAGFVQAKTHWNPPRLPDAPFRLGLDLQGGTHLVYEADMSDIPDADRASALDGVRDVIERRVNAFGVSEPVVQTVNTGGTYRIIVELAGVLDVNAAINQIGETPVLEFKEPGKEAVGPLTDAEKAQLAKLNADETAAAKAVLAQARAGANFPQLIASKSIEKSPDGSPVGDLKNLTTKGTNGPIVSAVLAAHLKPGQVLPTLVQTADGLNVVKYVGPTQSTEMLLSDILFCFQGKTGCTNDLPALDASIRATNVLKTLTPQNFADVAKAQSDDAATKANGGDLGWVEPGQRAPAYELAARQLKVGAISTQVVEDEFGYHLIYKRDERPVTTYEVQRVLLPFSTAADVQPNASPWQNTGLSGKDLTRATVEFDQNSGAPQVALQFNAEGAKLFGDLTASHVGQPIAIFLDGSPISTPVVQAAIYGGQAVITGTFTVDEAKLLAQRLNAGALPVPVKLISQETVGPTLGIASLQQSLNAALIGFALVAAFMIFLYRLPGVLSILALILYAFLNIAAYRLFGVTMTLSGIAGLVLSLGIAVDANVLIFERMKDEYRSGRDLPTSIAEGFKRAWAPIRDGHFTTFISAAVLYAFSSSFVKGFALTLGVGVVLSLFTAITVTQTYMRNVADAKFLQNPVLYALKRKKE
jgi:protein-export membrane protein SecD